MYLFFPTFLTVVGVILAQRREMKTLKELCEKIIYQKCYFESVNSGWNWLDCGFRCIPFRFYQELVANTFWYCECKKRTFFITKQNTKPYTYISEPENCFHCWFTFLIEIKIKIVFKKRDNLVHLASSLIEFFKLINKFKYIYVQPNYEEINHFDNYESFNYYLNPNLGCLCYNNDSAIDFL